MRKKTAWPAGAYLARGFTVPEPPNHEMGDKWRFFTKPVKKFRDGEYTLP